MHSIIKKNILKLIIPVAILLFSATSFYSAYADEKDYLLLTDKASIINLEIDNSPNITQHKNNDTQDMYTILTIIFFTYKYFNLL